MRRRSLLALPLAAHSLDVMIANLPFGIRVGQRQSNFSLYCALLSEARRTLRPGGRLVAYTEDSAAFTRAARQDWPNFARIAVIQAGVLGRDLVGFVDVGFKKRRHACFDGLGQATSHQDFRFARSHAYLAT